MKTSKASVNNPRYPEFFRWHRYMVPIFQKEQDRIRKGNFKNARILIPSMY